MRLRAGRRAIYAAMALTVLAMTGGYALANVSLGSPANQAEQGAHSTSITPVAELTWASTTLTGLNASVGNTSGCASTTGCDVSSKNATFCDGSTHSGKWCASGDYVEEVVLNTTMGHALAGKVTLRLFLSTTNGTYTGAQFNITNSATGSLDSDEPIAIDFDVGSSLGGPAVVTDVTVIAAV